MKNNLAPIIFFVYKRPEHTQQVVDKLLKNELANESDLFIYADGAKTQNDIQNVNNVRKYIKTIRGFKNITIVEREKNFGLAENTIDGITNIVNNFGKIIMLEDDNLVSENFLQYMNDALDFYEKDQSIYSVSGYKYPFDLPKNFNDDVFILYRFASWGWGTWKDRWEKIDWNIEDYNKFKQNRKAQELFNRGGSDLSNMLKSFIEDKKVNSWSVRFAYAHYKNNAFALFPKESLVHNIGHDGSGYHCKPSSEYDVTVDEGTTQYNFIDNIKLNKDIYNNFSRKYRKNIFFRILDKIWKKRNDL